jgi:hypothetical protein
LFVTVRPSNSFPGARWTLHLYNVGALRSTVLVSATSMGMFPLGWSSGRILYAQAFASGTNVYQVVTGRGRFISILLTQPLTSALLSPDGTKVAFTAPSSCDYCTLDTFDLRTLSGSYGPSGLSSEDDIAWSDDSRSVLALAGTRLLWVGLDGAVQARYLPPSRLPQIWTHPMRVSSGPGPHRVTLLDTATGATFVAAEAVNG